MITSQPVYNSSPLNSTLKMGSTTVAVAGTAVVLATATPCHTVMIQARSTNSDSVFIGTSAVLNDATNGWELIPGGSFAIDLENLNELYLNAAVGTEGVNYLYW